MLASALRPEDHGTSCAWDAAAWRPTHLAPSALPQSGGGSAVIAWQVVGHRQSSVADAVLGRQLCGDSSRMVPCACTLTPRARAIVKEVRPASYHRVDFEQAESNDAASATPRAGSRGARSGGAFRGSGAAGPVWSVCSGGSSCPSATRRRRLRDHHGRGAAGGRERAEREYPDTVGSLVIAVICTGLRTPTRTCSACGSPSSDV